MGPQLALQSQQVERGSSKLSRSCQTRQFIPRHPAHLPYPSHGFQDPHTQGIEHYQFSIQCRHSQMQTRLYLSAWFARETAGALPGGVKKLSGKKPFIIGRGRGLSAQLSPPTGLAVSLRVRAFYKPGCKHGAYYIIILLVLSRTVYVPSNIMTS